MFCAAVDPQDFALGVGRRRNPCSFPEVLALVHGNGTTVRRLIMLAHHTEGYIPISAVQLLCVSMSSNYSHIFTCVLPRSSLEIALSALRTHRATSMVINIRGCTRGSKSLMVGARKHPGLWRCAAA